MTTNDISTIATLIGQALYNQLKHAPVDESPPRLYPLPHHKDIMKGARLGAVMAMSALSDHEYARAQALFGLPKTTLHDGRKTAAELGIPTLTIDPKPPRIGKKNTYAEEVAKGVKPEKPKKPKKPSKASQKYRVVELTAGGLTNLTVSGELAILYMTSANCMPCQSFSPVVTAVAREYRMANFYRCCVDDNPELARQLNVRSVPTIIGIRDGVIVYHKGGAMGHSRFTELVRYLKNLDLKGMHLDMASRPPQAAPFGDNQPVLAPQRYVQHFTTMGSNL